MLEPNNCELGRTTVQFFKVTHGGNATSTQQRTFLLVELIDLEFQKTFMERTDCERPCFYQLKQHI